MSAILGQHRDFLSHLEVLWLPAAARSTRQLQSIEERLSLRAKPYGSRDYFVVCLPVSLSLSLTLCIFILWVFCFYPAEPVVIFVELLHTIVFTGFFSRVEWRSFSLVDSMAFLAPSIHIRVWRPSNSMSSECSNSLSTWSSYSGILAFPFSYFKLGRNVCWSLDDSWGPLSLVEIGLSSNMCRNRSSSSNSRSDEFGLREVGVEIVSSSYQDANSSKTMSWPTRTFWVDGL